MARSVLHLDARIVLIGVVFLTSRVVVYDHADFDQNHTEGGMITRAGWFCLQGTYVRS
jgi:hypothetical protein